MTTIEQHGKRVKIGEEYIPAVNPQVDGFPGYEDHHGVEYWYGIYFEYYFEKKSIMWIVEQGAEKAYPDKITVKEYKTFGENRRKNKPEKEFSPTDWDDFLNIYQEHLDA